MVHHHPSVQRCPATKPKPRWDVHLPGAGNRGGSVSALDCRTVRQRRLTSSFRLDSPARNLPTLSCTAACSPGTDCQWPPLWPSPSLIGVEVRAVARQVHQPQLQLRRPEVLPHRFPTVGRRIVPDDPQRPWTLFLQLGQEGNRGPAVAVALQFYPFHLARLQAHR